jgi:hypothetical protein
MHDLDRLAVVGIIVILINSPPLLAGDALFGDGTNVFGLETSRNVDHAKWRLAVANGELLFVARPRDDPTEARSSSKAVQKTLALQSFNFFKDGAMIRVRNQGGKTEKDDWYLTGDYSTKPPHVIVTKEATKYSRWTLVQAPNTSDPEEGINRYLKNENDQGKDAWLSMEDKGVRYKGGEVWEARKPTLSAEKKAPYYMENTNSGK